MPRIAEPFDVETLEWGKAVSEPIYVGDTAIMRDVLRARSRFPGVVFERYRFPMEPGVGSPSKSKSPFVIVSFSGKDCVVHRVNKGGSNALGNRGLRGLWDRVEHHLAGQDGLRVWTETVSAKNVRRALSRRARNEPRAIAEGNKAIRKYEAWQAFLRREGFSPRKRGDPKTPRIIGRTFHMHQPMLLRRPLKRGK